MKSSFNRHHRRAEISVCRSRITALPLLALIATTAGCAETPEFEEEIASSSAAMVENATLVPVGSRTSLELSIVHAYGCTATLVRPNWVLTAKHCVVDVATGLTYAPSVVTHDKGLQANISSIYIHPDPTVDAALLKLSSPINAGQPASVPLYTGMDTNLVGNTVTVYGYGGVTDLSRGTRTVERIENHGSMQGWQRYNRKYLHITGSVSGDSGGPSFRNGQIVAVTGGSDYKAATTSFRNWANSYLSPATNNHLGSKVNFGNNIGPNGSKVLPADVNGDGYVDLVQFNLTNGPVGRVYVVPGTASGFSPMVLWHVAFASGSAIPGVGDVNGDGLDDAIKFDQATGKVYVALSAAVGFNPVVSEWHSGFSFPGETPRVADVNGDGRDDIITFVHYQNWGHVWVSLSCGSNLALLPNGCNGTNRFGDRIKWHGQFSLLNEIPEVGDVNGDGLADLVTFNRANATASVALTVKKACTTNADCSGEGGNLCWTALGYCASSMGQPAGAKQSWSTNASRAGETPTIADMNGDGYVDIANFETTTLRNRNGYFGVLLSNGRNAFGSYSVWGTSVCMAGNICLTGDIARDGRADALSFVVAGPDYYARSLAN